MTPSKPKTLLLSLIVSYLLSALLLFALAFALWKLKLKEGEISAAVCAVYAAACFFGGLFTGKRIRSRRFFWGLASGVLYFAVLLLGSFLANRGAGFEAERVLTVLGCCLAGGMLGGMMS